MFKWFSSFVSSSTLGILLFLYYLYGCDPFVMIICDYLEGVPDLPVAPQDEAGLTKTFQTWPRGWFPIP